MKMWTDLSYEFQQQVLDKIENFLLKETDPDMQEGIIAAMTELEIWSNTPCKIYDKFEDFSNDHVSEAVDFPKDKQ